MILKPKTIYRVKYADLFGNITEGVGVPYSTKGSCYEPNAIGVVWMDGGVSSLLLNEKIELIELKIYSDGIQPGCIGGYNSDPNTPTGK